MPDRSYIDAFEAPHDPGDVDFDPMGDVAQVGVLGIERDVAGRDVRTGRSATGPLDNIE